jgi:hypothetical protein
LIKSTTPIEGYIGGYAILGAFCFFWAFEFATQSRGCNVSSGVLIGEAIDFICRASNGYVASLFPFLLGCWFLKLSYSRYMMRKAIISEPEVEKKLDGDT